MNWTLVSGPLPPEVDGMEVPHGLHWLPPCTLSGPWQMAIDAWLLERISQGERGGPLLRFYFWSRPTLSLGRHQKTLEPNWLRLAAEGRLTLVRRPSGGAAVLHGGDLTYSLIWPDPPRRRREAYHLCCLWLQEAFAAMGQPLDFGDSPARLDQANCFASSTAADLMHANGQKRIGSAQLWKRGCLLQHGSVAIEPDGALWEAVFDSPAPCLPTLPWAGEQLMTHLLGAALRWMARVGPQVPGLNGEVSLRSDPLQDWETEKIASTLSCYEVGLTSSLAAVSAMARATGSRANPAG